MIKKYISMLGVGGCLFLSGCSNDVTTVQEDGIQPILFTATQTTVSLDTETLTKATVADFPNGKSVAIIGAKSTSTTAPSDWSNGNLILNNAPATAGQGQGSTTVTYPIELTPMHYWPLKADKEDYYIGFIAYSPATNAALSHNATTLNVSVDDKKGFFDLLFTSPTSTAYNRDQGSKAIPLGEFKHAMAKLVVKVTPIDATTLNPISAGDALIKDLKITQLDVRTQVTSGSLNIQNSNPAWNLTKQDNSIIISKLVSSSTGLPYNDNAGVFSYLFPDGVSVQTAKLSSIGLTLKDGNITSIDNKTYLISDFKDTGNNSVALEMGKTTVLNIKIKVATVQTGENPTTTLEGTLVDWIYKGNSSVTIE